MGGDAKEVVSYGVKSFHVDAGKTATLTFSKSSKHDPATGISETQQYGFWCDIHPHMRGEFLILETKGEVGGGWNPSLGGNSRRRDRLERGGPPFGFWHFRPVRASGAGCGHLAVKRACCRTARVFCLLAGVWVSGRLEVPVS